MMIIEPLTKNLNPETGNLQLLLRCKNKAEKMNLQQRIDLLVKLGGYFTGISEELQEVKTNAERQNGWFTATFIDVALQNIAQQFLQQQKLQNWVQQYKVPQQNARPKKVGIVMAGNIPMVGFHDLLCVFVTGHKAVVKLSSKDAVLITHAVKKLTEWDNRVVDLITFAENLKSCDAYIATGSNNTARYFDYYFGKYPNIIRRNRTSAAVLDGTETPEELSLLADDIQLYFGLGCRNITKLYVPEGYDFIPLLEALKKYSYFSDLHKYRNNFDYHLALLLMNSKYYMSNESIILTENLSPFSPVSQVHYEFYNNSVSEALTASGDIQCIAGHGYLPFGVAQAPGLADYADGVDTMAFLQHLSS